MVLEIYISHFSLSDRYILYQLSHHPKLVLKVFVYRDTNHLLFLLNKENISIPSIAFDM